MPAATISHRAQEALAFAIRIRTAVSAPKKLMPDILAWLFARFGREGFAHRRMNTQAGSPQVFYFRRLEDAQEFLDTFPDLELANEAVFDIDAPERLADELGRVARRRR